MTDIIKLAKEAQTDLSPLGLRRLARDCGAKLIGAFAAERVYEFSEANIVTLVNRIRAEAMEEAAVLCESQGDQMGVYDVGHYTACAAAIRSVASTTSTPDSSAGER